MDKFLLIFVISLIISIGFGKNKLANRKIDANDQDAFQKKLHQFFGKYCNETNEKIIQKLEKCEDIQPQSVTNLSIYLNCINNLTKLKLFNNYI